MAALLSVLIWISYCTLYAAKNGGSVTVELWCVAKNNADNAALQSAIDWACGPGEADCGPIQKGGPCYDPSDIQKTASYAFNVYFLKNGMTEDSCNFDNTAALTSLNPSHGNCKLQSSKGKGNTTGAAATGLGPPDSAYLNSSSSEALGWTWGLIAVYLFYAITWIF